MAITNYKQWIEQGKPYQEGIVLLKTLSDNEALIELLISSEDDINRELLHDELGRIVPKGDFYQAESFAGFSEIKKTKWETRNFSDELKALSVRAGELTKKIDFHRNQLELLTTKEKRFQAAEIIVHASRERATIFHQLDHYQENGKLPEENKTEPENRPLSNISAIDLTLQYKNLASRICKAKKKGKLDVVKELEAERAKIKEVLSI